MNQHAIGLVACLWASALACSDRGAVLVSGDAALSDIGFEIDAPAPPIEGLGQQHWDDQHWPVHPLGPYPHPLPPRTEWHGAEIRTRPLTVAGPLARDAVRRVVLRSLGQVNFCYEQALAARPTVGGRFALRFVIDGEGTAIESDVVRSSTRAPSLDECLATAVRRWRFPASSNGRSTTARVTFDLRPPTPPAVGGASRPGRSTPASPAPPSRGAGPRSRQE